MTPATVGLTPTVEGATPTPQAMEGTATVTLADATGTPPRTPKAMTAFPEFREAPTRARAQSVRNGAHQDQEPGRNPS